DKECTNHIPQNYLYFDCYAVTYNEGIPSFLVPDGKKIYAKPKEVTQKDVLSDYEIRDGHILNLFPNDHFVFGGELDGYWIDTVELHSSYDYLFIGKDIRTIIIPSFFSIRLVYIDEDNPYLYSLNEDIYDKETNEMIIRHG
ncbi:MAG: hypothetical protein K2J85_04730, partial [Anaeroplasmataceae bacterium]|nr:hypothetical protein [Anaeroplasmataceae bacterium]